MIKLSSTNSGPSPFPAAGSKGGTPAATTHVVGANPNTVHGQPTAKPGPGDSGDYNPSLAGGNANHNDSKPATKGYIIAGN